MDFLKLPDPILIFEILICSSDYWTVHSPSFEEAGDSIFIRQALFCLVRGVKGSGGGGSEIINFSNFLIGDDGLLLAGLLDFLFFWSLYLL